MGRIISSSETPNETPVNHFSHPHPLKLHNHQPQQTLIQSSSCSACKLPVSGLTYSCTACNYFLHKKCFKMPRKINHPFHKQHFLSLLPKSVYPDGVFQCDACGDVGNGFSYHCEVCTVDIHVLCSVLPLSITHSSHPHTLKLAFESPYPTKSFCCDICRTNGSSHWMYGCSSCGFDAHLDCVNGSQSSSSSSAQNPNPQQNPTNFMDFQSQLGQNNGGFGMAGSPFMAGYANRQNEIFLQTLQQINNAQQNYLQTFLGVNGGGGNREEQQLLQMLSNLSINSGGGGSSGGIPGLDASGGIGGGGVPGFNASGGGASGHDFLQALINGDGGAGDIPGLDPLGGGGGNGGIPNFNAFGGGAGGQDFLQALINGGGTGGGVSNLNAFGGGASGQEFLQALTNGGCGSGGIPNFNAFGGGGGQEFLQAFINGGGGGGVGGGGGLEMLQSLLGGGNGLDLLGNLGGLL